MTRWHIDIHICIYIAINSELCIGEGKYSKKKIPQHCDTWNVRTKRPQQHRHVMKGWCSHVFTLRATQDTSVFSTHTQPFLAGLRSYWAVQGYCSESDSQSPAWRRRRWPTKTYDFWEPENGTNFLVWKFSPKCQEQSRNSTKVTLQCFPVSHLGTSEDFRIHLSGIIEDGFVVLRNSWISLNMNDLAG